MRIALITVLVVVLTLILLRILGSQYRDVATNISYEINNTLQDPSTTGDIDMRMLTGNLAWDTMHILLPGTNINHYLRNHRHIAWDADGNLIGKGSLAWHGERETRIEKYNRVVLLLFSWGFEVSAYAEVIREKSVIDFVELVRESGKSTFDYSEAVFTVPNRN